MKEKLLKLYSRYESILKYMFVGGLGVFVDNGTLTLLVDYMSVNVTLGKILSAEAAIISNFFINDIWTFKDYSAGTVLSRLLKSNLIRVLGVAVALVVLKVLHEGYGVQLVIANTVGIFLGFVFNFGFENLYTWQTHRD